MWVQTYLSFIPKNKTNPSPWPRSLSESSSIKSEVGQWWHVIPEAAQVGGEGSRQMKCPCLAEKDSINMSIMLNINMYCPLVAKIKRYYRCSWEGGSKRVFVFITRPPSPQCCNTQQWIYSRYHQMHFVNYISNLLCMTYNIFWRWHKSETKYQLYKHILLLVIF